MSTITFPASGKTFRQRATQEPAWVRRSLIGLALAFLTLFLFIPLISVFYEAFKKGAEVYFAAITDPDAVSAIKLTLTVAAIAVPLNLVFDASNLSSSLTVALPMEIAVFKPLEMVFALLSLF